MFGLSTEQQKWALTYKCPRCGGWPVVPRYLRPDGEQYRGLKLLPQMDRGTLAECPKCNQRWSVFGSSVPPPPPSSPPPYEARLRETERVEEPLGEEQRIIDNSKSSVKVVRSLSVSKEWVQTYTVEYEKGRADGGKLDLALVQGVGIQATAESSVKERYAVSGETRRTFTEQISMEVPKNQKVKVLLHWKRIWQHGILELASAGAPTLEVPFKVVVGVTFDQTLTDEAPPSETPEPPESL